MLFKVERAWRFYGAPHAANWPEQFLCALGNWSNHSETWAAVPFCTKNCPNWAHLCFYGQKRPNIAKIVQVHVAPFECLAILQWPLEACCPSKDSNLGRGKLSCTLCCIFAGFLKPPAGFVLSWQVKDGPQNTDFIDALSICMCLALHYWS